MPEQMQSVSSRRKRDAHLLERRLQMFSQDVGIQRVYFGSPAQANLAYGKESIDLAIEGNVGLIVRALHGENFSTHTRYPEGAAPPPFTEPPEERAFAAKLEQWLRERKRD